MHAQQAEQLMIIIEAHALQAMLPWAAIDIVIDGVDCQSVWQPGMGTCKEACITRLLHVSVH